LTLTGLVGIISNKNCAGIGYEQREERENMPTLSDLITEAGLRKKELSDKSGVDVATIIRIGNGKATTRVTVVKLVRVLEKYLNRSIDIDSIEGLNITR
jgi:predicted transcriptional regulator